MSVYIDRKYLLLIASNLDRFSKKKDDLFNFRCPFCGDSEKNKLRARGYIYRKGNDYFYSCHNCGSSHNFYNFLKFVEPSKLNEYRMETFVDKNGTKTKIVPDTFEATTKDINLPKISSLSDEHFAKKYILERKIPTEFIKNLYFANDFKQFVKTMTEDVYDLYENDPRIVIPFYNSKKNLIYFQGRSLMNSKIKYITIQTSKNYPKIFGLDRVNLNKKVYVLEGPIDSMFLDNAIATADSDLTKSDVLKINNSVLIFDNEPRNREIVMKIEKAIKTNHTVCLFPDTIKQKDINEQILFGRTKGQIKELVDKYSFSGLRANLEFMKWRKV